MALVFYPIENQKLLESFRNRLNPFLVATSKALNTMSRCLTSVDGSCLLADEIITTLPTTTNSSPLMTEFHNYFRSSENRTLTAEHENLIAINLRYTILTVTC